MTKILYVEDNDDNVYMLKMRLELLGDFDVVAAPDGEQGCAMALCGRFAAALSVSRRGREVLGQT